MMLCIDNGALLFELRNNIILGIIMYIKIIVKFGLIIYVGRGNKWSKTKVLFVPSTTTLKY